MINYYAYEFQLVGLNPQIVYTRKGLINKLL